MRREKQIHLRVTEKEAKRLARVARHHKLGVSATIRMLVKQESLRLKRARDAVVGAEEPFGRGLSR